MLGGLVGSRPINEMETTIFKGSETVKKGLPSGYNWRLDGYSDDEGSVFMVTLVASRHEPGSWKDKVFGRKILNASCEVEHETEEDVIESKIEELKNELLLHFFHRA